MPKVQAAKGRGRGRGKNAKGGVKRKSPEPAEDPAERETAEEEEQPPRPDTPPRADTPASNASSSPSSHVSQAPDDHEEASSSTKKKKKKKNPPLMLTPEQENDVAEWLKANEFLYNMKLLKFHKPELRERAYEEKAKELGIPDKKQLKTWVKSMRDRVGKIENMPSGSGAESLSERDQWIWDSFGHLTKHIRRTQEGKRKKGGQLAQSLGTKSAATSSSYQPPASPVSDIIVDSSDGAGSSVSRSRLKTSKSSGMQPPSSNTQFSQVSACTEFWSCFVE